MAAKGQGWRIFSAGAASAALLPTLVFAVHAPLWAAAVGAVTAFGGLVLVLSPKRPFEGVDPKRISAGRLAVVRAAVDDAQPALEQLEQAAGRIRDKAVKGRVTAIAVAGRGVIADLETAPEGLAAVQRLLTYYIPRAGELAQGYAQMEARGVGDERRAGIAELLVKLKDAFDHYRDQQADQELRALDVDMRLVGDALREDLGQTPRPAPAPTSVPTGGGPAGSA